MLYKKLYNNHGYSPKSLGCSKGKQFLRFHQLTTDWDMNGVSILDVGCGFGDFIKYLDFQGIANYSYTGIDIMEEFIAEGRKRYSADNVSFLHGDFLDHDFEDNYDYAIASGTFNLKMDGVDGYDYIYKNMTKMFALSTRAVSIDFISNKVDYAHGHNFNSSPEKILSMAYTLSRNVLLKNTYFPFEFSITIYKDDSFRKETTIFTEVEQRMAVLVENSL
jgi:SAM-dependent methyltransferase